jgi:hypothetical protein
MKRVSESVKSRNADEFIGMADAPSIIEGRGGDEIRPRAIAVVGEVTSPPWRLFPVIELRGSGLSELLSFHSS